MAINLMGNRAPLDSEIEAESMVRLDKAMPPREREKLSHADMLLLHADIDEQESVDKADRDLLRNAIKHERSEQRLAKPVLDNKDYPDARDDDGQFTRHPALVKDDEEREAADAVVAEAGAETLALVSERKTAGGSNA